MMSAPSNTMNIGDALRWANETLLEKEIDTARLDAEVLLTSVMQNTREDLIKEPGRNLSAEQIERFEAWIARRKNKEPVAYIIGHREFWSMDFKVTPDVLIPRPDTEILIETFLKYCPASEGSSKILDVGTGSGVIAIVVANERPRAEVIATDISESALEIAKENAQRLGESDRIKFVKAQGLDDAKLSPESFDFIVSNPPYVACESPELSSEVKRYEPQLAWDGGEDGLEFYRQFVPEVQNFLVPGGTCLLEIGYDQADALRLISESTGGLFFEGVVPDYAGRDRVVILKRKMHG